jgi:hypothetical protein
MPVEQLLHPKCPRQELSANYQDVDSQTHRHILTLIRWPVLTRGGCGRKFGDIHVPLSGGVLCRCGPG